jgi:DNA-binding NarL/FixJ family response regulator
MREQGKTYGQIARAIKCSDSAVSWHCLRLGAESPKSKHQSWSGIKGPVLMKRGEFVVRRFTPEDDERLLQLEASGLRICEIARQLKRRHNSVKGRLMTLARRDERREQREAA